MVYIKTSDYDFEEEEERYISKDKGSEILTINYYSEIISIYSNETKEIEIEFSEKIYDIISIKSEEVINKQIDINKDDIQNALKNLIKEIEIGKNYEIKGNDFV